MKKGWQAILVDFEEYVGCCITDNADSQKSYVSYIRSLDKANGGLTHQWLKDAVLNENPIKYLSETFDGYFKNNPDKTPQNQWKTGLKRLGDFICGFTHSTTNLRSIKNFDSIVCELVAKSAIFCPKEIFDKVKNGELGSKENLKIGNAYGSWYNCKYQRATSQQKRRETVGNIILDDNTFANTAIKLAILKGLEKFVIHGNEKQIFRGYEACHIWPKTCYDARYHTSVGNIVLLPREIAGLSDHCQAVEDLLKYEAWRRFGFKPEEEAIPQRPNNYSKIIWRNYENIQHT